MAEAIAAVGALSSFLQVVEFAAKLVSHTRQLLDDNEEALHSNGKTRQLFEDYARLGKSSAQLRNDHGALKVKSTAEEQIISRLGSDCEIESGKLLDQLKGLTIDPNAKGIRRITEATRKAVKHIKERKEIERAHKHVQEVNGQLSTAMLQELLVRQRAFAEPSAQALEAAIGFTAGNDVDKVVDFAREYRRLQRRTDLIIDSLRFDEVTLRQDAIDEAYPETYRWALKSDELPLKTWLRDGKGVFWITGKAGSGKSTLMKYLCEQKRTRQLLAHTGHGQNIKLVFASFYFWYAGTTMQKSTLGLLRTIMHTILVNDRELGEVAFPHRFGADEDYPGGISFKDEEIVDGLKAIARQGISVSERKRFCFFIDGLDEYNGHAKHLINIISDLSSDANIKLCVSSRPWTAFKDAFESSVPNLRLEDLSRPDVEHYVSSCIHNTLSQSPKDRIAVIDTEAQLLVKEIVEKAEGVFLWVVLVVKSILQGLEEHDPISMLRHRVREFPADLEEFFENILGRVDRVYKSQTYQSLKLAYMYAEADDKTKEMSSFLDFWFIRQQPQGLASADFVKNFSTCTVSAKVWQDMRAETQYTLSATCKDLLFLTNVPVISADNWEDDVHDKVQFLHRTVHDFLRTDKIQRIMSVGMPAIFDSDHLFHLLNATRLKYVRLDRHGERCEPSIRLELAAELFSRMPREYATEDYMTGLEEAMLHLRHGMRPLSLADFDSRFSIPLIALQRNDFVTGLLQRNITPTRPDRTIRIANTLAAFGENAQNRFDVLHISTEVVQKLDDVGLIHHSATEEGSCNGTLWQLFLRKWAIIAQRASGDSPQPLSSDQLRHAWNLATWFLDDGVSLQEEFCSSPFKRNDAKHRHIICSATEFIKAQVPSSWLCERRDTRRLVRPERSTVKKREHEEGEMVEHRQHKRTYDSNTAP